ncbi:MAG: hypothetical protein GX756_05565 [Clostridiales bacterium]|nr:hypothetical protein [Clostridiales bacterium]
MIFYKAHIILIFFICVIIVSILINPVKYIQSALDGLIVWATVIVPAVFPFLFFSLALIELGMAQKISKIFYPLTSKLFKTGGVSAYIFFMSLISGYPIGAKLIEDFYNKGFIDSYEGARIISFCSMASPMFVLGSVGIGLLKSYAAGLILLISQILSNIINGLIFSNYKSKNFQSKLLIAPQTKNADNVLSECVYNSVISVLTVGGFIAIFYMIAEILNDIYFLYPLRLILEKLGINENFSDGLTRGLIEITNGCLHISAQGGSLIQKTVCCGFLISWGGLSVHFQNLAFLTKSGIKISFYFLSKTTQSLIMLIITLIFCLIFLR